MTRQDTFAEAGFEKFRKKTRREQFLDDMEKVVPWDELVCVIKPHYPKSGGRGRQPIGIERMLRIYFLQHWFNLSDPGVEEALYDSNAMRAFAGIDLGREPVPDETTVCKFRHLLEKHNLAPKMFLAVNHYLALNGIKVSNGTIVDAAIINAPSSTKNKEKKRDPDMHQTKKGNQWYFGMKMHIGVDSKTKLVHSIATTSANVHDSQMLQDLLHGEETRVWGDSAYTGQRDKILEKSPYAQDFTHHKGFGKRQLTETQRRRNKNKSKVRAKVEHVFHVSKRVFGFNKTRYKGLQKNTTHVVSNLALVNLYMTRRKLLTIMG